MFAIPAALFAIITGLTYAFLSVSVPTVPVVMHVRWKPTVSSEERIELERRFTLTAGELDSGTTWKYALIDASTDNIKALIQHEAVEDTAHLNRVRYRPELAQDRQRRLPAYAAATGVVGCAALLLMAAIRRRVAPVATMATGWTPTVDRASPLVSQTTAGAHVLGLTQSTIVVVLVTTIAVAVMIGLAGAPPGPALGTVVCVYVCGYVVGGLLVRRSGDGSMFSVAIVRTVAGLLLSTIAFLLSLVVSLPWFTFPALVLAGVIAFRRGEVFALPRAGWPPTRDGIVAGVLSVMILSPIWLSLIYMAPGPFPPVFYNIDTAYTLEKVHALVAANSYPPPSLSNIGIHRSYHYGSQAMAAFISRGTGLPPHQSLFLVVLPLLTAGLLAAAAAAARHLCPALPRAMVVPLLLVSTPSLSRSFWHALAPQLGSTLTAGDISFGTIFGNTSLWGVLSNESMNVGGDFMILGSIAGIAAAPLWGWRLAAFLIGSAMLVKTTVGVALMAGFGLAELWRTLTSPRPWPSRQALLAAVTFIGVFVAFFVVSFESNFQLEFDPLYHLRQIVATGTLTGSFLDVLWLCLPIAIVWTAGLPDPEGRSAPYLLMALAPLALVNITRLNNTGVGGGGSGDDWLQNLHAVPFLLHAFALSLAAARWARLGTLRRVAFLSVTGVTAVSVALAASYYSMKLIEDPQSGTDFVDNRSLAAALAVIPTKGTIVVTNDLRYPAGNFTRDYRQMQIPALFGHQAFAVNYAHEAVEERRGLQELLQQPQWSEAILDAARVHHWTHFIIRKDYSHANPLPLRRIFDNEDYAVFTFPE